MILIYRHRSGDAEWKGEQYPVRIVRTPCNLGGLRAWFICPAVGCGRRVAILYGGSIFACRRCYQLAYPEFARGCRWTCYEASGQAPGAAGLGTGILNGNGREAEMDSAGAHSSGWPPNMTSSSDDLCRR